MLTFRRLAFKEPRAGEVGKRMERVAVAGTGRAPFRLGNGDQSIVELVAEAVEAAVGDAGIELADVNAAVTASVDLWDGRTASNVSLTEVVGAVMRPETRIAADGLAAFAHATMTVAAGAHETVLCVAHCKPSEADHLALTAWTLDPVLLQPLGLDDAACAGLQAAACGADPERWAEAVVRARERAAHDPLGPGLPVPEAGEVTAAPPLARPLTEAMAAPLLDGAVAAVLTRSAGASGRPRVAGFGYAIDEHYLGDRDLAGVPALRSAAARAVRNAGGDGQAVGDGGLTVAELSAPYAHQEALFAEAIGLRGAEAGIADPDSDRGGPAGAVGDVVLNPSGGGLAGAPPFAAGLARLVEVARRLDGGGRGLAHGTWGPAAQAHCVVVLES